MSKRVTVEGFLSCFLLCCGLVRHLCFVLLWIQQECFPVAEMFSSFRKKFLL